MGLVSGHKKTLKITLNGFQISHLGFQELWKAAVDLAVCHAAKKKLVALLVIAAEKPR